ncbi:MAG TPA: DUF3365 domain-containing protein [Bryobacteraceae bacterium]|nr:DUF3365 domain-containing protein [Bryobacteraceae bacterium]
MKLLPKFTLIFTLVFGAGLAIAAAVCHRFLERNAREQVLEQARLMMETMRASRDYTTHQVGPLLQVNQAHDRMFLPQTVPAYAATETFNYLRTQYPDYAYKEAALNPTNLRDRAVDWEADLISAFRRDARTRELTGEREAATGRALFLARPIRATPPCLECHDRARAAPAAMLRRYGTANGFGWNANEVIGAQIVSVPMALPLRMAGDSFRTLLLSLAGIFLLSLVVLDAVVVFTIARPVARLSAMADQISMGQMDLPELPVRGSDEISVLAGSFNRMRRSLQQALKMLGE